MAEIELAHRGDGVAESRRSRGPNTVKHIRAQCDGYDEILRIADTHDIPRFSLWEQGGACVNNAAVRVFCLATRQTADCDAGRVPLNHLFRALPAEVKVKPTLDDAEQILAIRVFVSGEAPVQPPDRAMHGFFNAWKIRGCCGYHIIQLHYDVRSNRILQRDGMLWREKPSVEIINWVFN